VNAFSEEAVRVALPRGRLDYTLRRSPHARRVRVVVDPRRGVLVTVPGGRHLAARDGRRVAADFVREREAWIRRHLDRQARQRAEHAARGPLGPGSRMQLGGVEHALVFVPAPQGTRRAVVLVDAGAAQLIVRPAQRDTRPLDRVLRDWVRERARAAIEEAIDRHASALGVRPVAVTIRDPRTRWGSASRAGRLSFSWRLALAPPEALETVVVHELAHLQVFGHGPRFWALVASRRSDHLLWRRWLRDHSVELHAALETPDGEAA
jgi:predicted metal-dependent hydrolase